MRQYRVALLRKEFPFIDHLVGVDLKPEDVTGIGVKKGDKALLNSKGSEDSYSWSGGGHYNYTRYFAVLDEKVLGLASAGYSGTGSGESREWDANTIGEQLFREGIVPEYIVECVQNDTDDNGNGEVTRFWTIYKMKRFDLSAYHQEQIDRAAVALKAEIAAACA